MINMEFLAKVQRNGIIVIPKNIREFYNADVGDMVKLNFVEKTEKPSKVTA
jgi:AbrB family looped-hinge helix DNA binding protein